jgi:hypothetical protein
MVRCAKCFSIVCVFFSAVAVAADDSRELRIEIHGTDGKPLPCRVHLANEQGAPQLAPGLPSWRDHFNCNGTATLTLPPGKYNYAIERGPEHQRLRGELDLKAGREAFTGQLKRIANLVERGWHAGDLHVHRKPEDVELLMQSEDLQVAQVISWWNQRNLWSDRSLPVNAVTQFDGGRFYDVLAGEDERGGGALLFHRMSQPLEITKAKREFPASIEYGLQARQSQPSAWIDIEKPFWWDVPLWLAHGLSDSIGLANNHMQRLQMYPGEAWGKPRDEARLSAPHGNAYWTQEIYYHVLNSGLRIPPSAGSASGVLANPVGYNRVYVQTTTPLKYEAWWDGLRAGRCFVTNGPLLLVTANSQPPGAVLRASNGDAVEIALNGELVSVDRVPRLEIVVNGEVQQTVTMDGSMHQNWTATLSMPRSGWILVRAIADVPETFRFASTGPFYVEVGDQPRRVSRRSAQFFADWLRERQDRVTRAITQEAELKSMLSFYETASQFWDDRLRAANAE